MRLAGGRNVFHFFEKKREFIGCEIDEKAKGQWQIVIIEPSGHEVYTSSDAAHQRWRELQVRFTEEGWFGPYGRE